VSDSAESETRSRKPRGGAREPNQAQRATPPGDGPEAGKSTRLRGLPARAKAAAREARTRAEDRRESVALVGVAFDVIERDSGFGGGILAGALA
jgi:hypothetical protein